MKKNIYLLYIFIIFSAIGCGDGCESSGTTSSNDLVEDRTIYNNDDLTVLEISLTIGNGAAGDATYAAWKAACIAYDESTDPEPAPVTATFSEGTFSQTAELRLRGASTRTAVQKSFKIEFTDKSNLWRQQNNINLMKHYYDLTRVRNKLSFDLFKNIPHFTSLRTQFVHLTINTEEYGLYEMIENCDKLFLTNHGLDPDGHLYKVKDLSFSTVDLSYLQTAIEDGDLAAFEAHLEAKGNINHTKLLQMLNDVNNNGIDIDEVINRHFNRNNYLTWLAINILMFNRDTVNQNFYLYSPANSAIWYFLPWDYDGAWGWEEEPDNLVSGKSVFLSRMDFGMANYWRVTLHKRFIQKAQNLTDLNTKITYLRTNYLTDSAIGILMDSYDDIVIPYVDETLPSEDNAYLPLDYSTYYAAEYARIRNDVLTDNKDNFTNNIANPMPVWLGMEDADPNIAFYWDASYDLQGNNIAYTFQIVSTPFSDFLNASPDNPPAGLIFEETGLTGVTYSYPKASLPADDYWWRVIIYDDDTPNNWQIPFDGFWDESGTWSGNERTLFGMFYFNKDAGGILTDAYGNTL